MTDGVLDKVAFQIDADLGPLKSRMREVDDIVNKTGGGLKKHLNDGAAGAEKLHRGIEVSRRELLYMGREVATGDLQRLPSTLVLIGSHMAGLTSQGILMGGAIVGPFALMVTAAVQAERAQERVRLSIAKTGDAAGVTAGQIVSAANRVSSKGGISQRGALDVASTLVGGGNIPGGNISSGIEATNAFSKMSGQTLDKSAEALSKMMADPAKAAKDLHDQFKLLSDAEMLRIQRLPTQAEQEKAIFEALIKRGKDVETSMWSLSKAFDGMGTFFSNLWFKTGSMFSGGPNTLDDRYNTAMATAQRQQLALSQHARGITPGMVQQSFRTAGDLHWQLGASNRQAKADADATAKDQAAEAARSPGALELRKYRDESRISRLSPRDRDMARARADASRTYQGNLNNPDMVKYAGGIEGASINAAQATQNAARRDALNLTVDSAKAEESLAMAYRTSTSAGEAQNATNKAHAEFLKGAIDDEKGYADALRRTADAEREINAAKQDQKITDSNGELELEISLLGANEDLRTKRVALLKAENDLVAEGYDLSTQAGQAELQRRQQEIGRQQDDLKLKKDITEEQQRNLSVAKDAEGILGSVFEHANQGAAGLKSLLPDITSQILSMIEKMAILNPLENAITGGITGTNGKLPTAGNSGPLLKSAGSWIASLFNGAGAPAPKMAANGMVLGGPTMFHTGSGPVVGGEAGHEALVPLARGPGGSLGIKSYGGGRQSSMPDIHQHITIHPDVSAVARGEIVKALPQIQTAALDAYSAAVGRGFVPGGISP